MKIHHREHGLNTPVESAVKQEWDEANTLLQRFAGDHGIELHVPELQGAVFCGHLVTDLDSIAGAIGAAALYGGIAARASDVNPETQFALEFWGLEAPPPVETLDTGRVCLVDFQQKTQLHASIDEAAIVGIIDHHALQSSTIVTNKPIFVDIRPWGSMSTIVAHSFVTYAKFLDRKVAGLLLSAILSDTLNLRSPTTTAWDRKLVSLLVQYTAVADVNQLCADQFKAKSRLLTSLSAYSLVSGDLKRFKMNDEIVLAFSVVETTDVQALVDRVDDLLVEMRTVKKELGVALIFLALVDIVGLQSFILLVGPRERALAQAANLGDVTDGAMLRCPPGKVSRKADFIPPLTSAFPSFVLPPEDPVVADDPDTEIVLEQDAECPGGRLVRRPSLALAPT